MDEIKVEITQLEPLRVVYIVSVSESPELEAQGKLLSWAKSKGLLNTVPAPRFFGFNNPNPSHGSEIYGYEFWMTVGESYQPEEGGLPVKRFGGGLYAVTELVSVWNIPETWEALNRWLECSRYIIGKHQWLEEHVQFIDLPLDQYRVKLFLPVAGR